MKIKIKRLVDTAVIPTLGTEHSAGYDIYASEDCEIENGSVGMVHTGLSIEPESNDYAIYLLPRSGFSTRRRLIVPNSLGLIDPDYRGEMRVPLLNLSGMHTKVKTGERIAQLVVLPIIRPEFEEVDELSSTERGAGGFGSTGV